MEVEFKRGIYLRELDLWLDSLLRRDLGLISHAHTDHIARHARPILTRNTGALLSEYLKKSEPIFLEYGEPFNADRYTLTLYPAGHCLGSAQTLVQSKATGARLLYTGDIKIRSSPVNEPLEAVQCDVLLLEATYGRPQYNFPPQEQVLNNAHQVLRSWISKGEKPVLLGWRLGKAQELLHLLLGEGFEVALEESVYGVARVYEEAGITFPGQVRLYDGRWPEGQVLICPPSGKRTRDNLNGVRGLRFMELTGWAIDGGVPWGRKRDASLAYSDHPGFDELVQYVAQVQPKQVYTVNGFPELAAHLRKLGYPALHLDGAHQPDGRGFQLKLL